MRGGVDPSAALRAHLAHLDDARERALASFEAIELLVRSALDTCDGTPDELRALVLLHQTCQSKHAHVRRHTGPTLQELAVNTILWK